MKLLLKIFFDGFVMEYFLFLDAFSTRTQDFVGESHKNKHRESSIPLSLSQYEHIGLLTKIREWLGMGMHEEPILCFLDILNFFIMLNVSPRQPSPQPTDIRPIKSKTGTAITLLLHACTQPVHITDGIH